MYDIELCAVPIEKHELHSKSRAEMETLSIGSRVDRKELLADLLESDRAKSHKEALQRALPGPTSQRSPWRVYPANEAVGEQSDTDSDSDDNEEPQSRPTLYAPLHATVERGGGSSRPRPPAPTRSRRG